MKIHEQRSASATAVGIGLMVALAVLDDEIDQELAPGRQVMSMKKWCLNSANQSTEGFVFERNGLERPGQFGNNRGEGRGGLACATVGGCEQCRSSAYDWSHETKANEVATLQVLVRSGSLSRFLLA